MVAAWGWRTPLAHPTSSEVRMGVVAIAMRVEAVVIMMESGCRRQGGAGVSGAMRLLIARLHAMLARPA